jgi:hypothetical protein
MNIPNLNTPEIQNAIASLYVCRVQRRIAHLAYKADKTFTGLVNATLEEMSNGKEKMKQLKAERKKAHAEAKCKESKAITHLMAVIEAEAARHAYLGAYGEAQAEKMARAAYEESLKRF